ncbi:unnamed protein product [Bursaphelenchus xylophilus]|uniref:(pine wood nematode) hypothetical protein n=1 Tax=Bursaphelenchus xylophilus TaxID=6326 RepID=A0A1I7SEL2_BURXY|nr:unnamed protein product [Bursaphelenchus xylophilus]CAG9113620.1 unnamed protein product [Bursaphelenchus xylophilus]
MRICSSINSEFALGDLLSLSQVEIMRYRKLPPLCFPVAFILLRIFLILHFYVAVYGNDPVVQFIDSSMSEPDPVLGVEIVVDAAVI